MKYYTYLHNGYKIEFFKTYFGKETVFVDEKLVSEEHSIIGATHFFKINNTQMLVKTDYNLLVSNAVCLKIYRKRKKIDSHCFEFRKRHRVSLLLTLILFLTIMVRLYSLT